MLRQLAAAAAEIGSRNSRSFSMRPGIAAFVPQISENVHIYTYTMRLLVHLGQQACYRLAGNKVGHVSPAILTALIICSHMLSLVVEYVAPVCLWDGSCGLC
jgi:hypothetical protein